LEDGIFFCVSLGPRIFILKPIRKQIIFNYRRLLKDEEAIDWKGGFRSFHWAKGISSRKGHGGLPREREVSWVGERKKEEKECVKK
jgi:ribosomal protein L37E